MAAPQWVAVAHGATGTVDGLTVTDFVCSAPALTTRWPAAAAVWQGSAGQLAAPMLCMYAFTTVIRQLLQVLAFIVMATGLMLPGSAAR